MVGIIAAEAMCTELTRSLLLDKWIYTQHSSRNEPQQSIEDIIGLPTYNYFALAKYGPMIQSVMGNLGVESCELAIKFKP